MTSRSSLQQVALWVGSVFLGLALGLVVHQLEGWLKERQRMGVAEATNQFFQPTTPERARSSPPKMRAFLRGFSQQVTEGGGLWFDHSLLAAAVSENPVELFNFLFHDAPQSLAERLLPEAAALLAPMDSATILRTLSGARTRSELYLAWNAVLSAKIQIDPTDALKLALKAPVIAQVGNSFMKSLMLSQPATVLPDLLDQGMPRAWLWSGFEGLPPERFARAFDVLQKKFAGDWKFTDIQGLLMATPNKRDAAQTVINFFQEAKLFQKLSVQEKRDLASNLGVRNPAATALWLESITDNYQRSVLRQQALVAASKIAAYQGKPDVSAVEAVKIGLSNTEVSAPIIRMAATKVSLATLDGGVSAMEWALNMPDEAAQNTALQAVLKEVKTLKPFAGLTYLAKNPSISENELFMNNVALDIQQRYEKGLGADESRLLHEATGVKFDEIKRLLETRGITVAPHP